jgi:hypothetical protein
MLAAREDRARFYGARRSRWILLDAPTDVALSDWGRVTH